MAKGKAKGVKRIAEDSNTKPQSSIAQNNRRKIERLMAKEIREKTGKKVYGKEAVKMYERGEYISSDIKSLYQARESQYAKRNESGKFEYETNTEIMSETISAYTQGIYGIESLNTKSNGDQKRKNKLFQREINQSTMKNGLSSLSKETTKGFYAATKDLWSGLSNAENRNTQIMNAFGIQDLSTVYKLLTAEKLDYKEFGFDDKELFGEWIENLDQTIQLSKRREIVLEELQSISNIENTNEPGFNGSEEKSYESSPEYINRIISRIAAALNYA